MKKILSLVFLLSCYLGLEAQISVSYGSNPPSNSNAVCEGSTYTLSTTLTCASASDFKWYENGVVASGLGTAATTAALSMPSSTITYGVSCSADASPTQTLFLFEVQDPQISFTMDPVCDNSSGFLIPAQVNSSFTANCGTCTAFNWTFTDGLSSTYSPSGQILSETYVGLDPGRALDLSTTVTVEVTGEDGFGCEWTTPTQNLVVGVAPFSAFSLLPDPMTVSATSINLSNNGSVTWYSNPLNTGAGSALTPPAAYLSSHYATLNSGPGAISGNYNYYPLSTGTANITYTAVTNSGCTYEATDDVSVNGTGSMSFANNTTSSASANWEACVNDSITFTFSNLNFTPAAVRMIQLGSVDTVIDLSTLTTSFSGVSPNISGTVSFNLPDNISSGTICFRDAVSAASDSVCSPQPLIANNPERGFAIIKNPICYTDSIAIYTVPSGGTFSAFNIDTITGSPVYSYNTNLIVGDTMISGAGLLLNPATQNNGGAPVRVQYKYLPKYSDGASCPDTLRLNKDVFIRDNRLFSASLPTATADTTNPAAVYNLSQNIQNIYPTPVYPYTSFVDTSFSGTFVQQNSNTGDYEFLLGLSGNGEYEMTLSMDNGGCEAQTNIRLYIQPPANIPDLPSVICSGADSVEFHRDSSLAYQSGLVDTTYRLNCPVIIISFPPIGLRPAMNASANNYTIHALDNSRGGLLGGSGNSTSLIDIPANSVVAGNSDLFNPISGGAKSFAFCYTVKNTRRTRSLNELVSVEAYADTGTPLTYNQVVYGNPTAPTQIPNAVAKPNGMNGNPEDFFLLIPTVQTWMASNPGSDTSLYVAMVYRNISATEYYTADGTMIDGARPTEYDTSYNAAIQRIDLVSVNSIGVIDSALLDYYCYNTPAFNVPITPAYEPGYSTVRFTKLGATLTYHTLPDDILDIDNDPFFQDTINRTYIVEYEYTKYYGCDDSGSDTFTVVAPIAAYFNGPNTNNIYCANQQEVFFTPYPAPTTGLGGVFTGSGMGVDNAGATTVNNMFAPAQAGTGTHQITYTYTDVYSCISSARRNIVVRAAPVTNLTPDQSDHTYCANDTAAILTGTPITSGAGTGSYYGPTIVGDNIFHPNQAYLIDSSAAAGGVSVVYQFVDTFGCKGADTIDIFIQTLPVLQINNLASRYCENAALITNIQGVDLTGIAASSSNPPYFTGQGIVGTSSYSPSQAGAGLDTVWYIRTNTYGCRDSISKYVTIDSMPRPSINNLAPEYCINEPSFILSGSPVAVPPTTTRVFTGLGVNYNTSTGAYSFSAQTAANSGGVEQNVWTTMQIHWIIILLEDLSSAVILQGVELSTLLLGCYCLLLQRVVVLD